MSKRNLPAAPSFPESLRGLVRGSASYPNAAAEGMLHQVAAKYEETQATVAEVGDAVKVFAKDSKERLSELQARLQSVEQVVAKHETEGGFPGSASGNYSSIGAVAAHDFSELQAFSELRNGNTNTCRLSLSTPIKAALTNESGGSSSEGSYIPSQPDRRGIVPAAQRAATLLDVLPTRPVSADAVEFIQLHSTGEAGEQEEEGDEKAEVDFEGELKRAEIVTIAAHTTASKQVLSDHSALQSNIDRVMRYKVLSRLEGQLINGVGGQGKILGLWEQATPFVPSVVIQAANIADLIGEALTAMSTNGFAPNLVLMNPTDWFRVRTTKDTDNGYLFGSPTAPVSPALWNVTVVATPTLAEGSALVLDTSFVSVLDREQTKVMLSQNHKDYFTRNLVSILGELRAGLEVLDTWAVYKIDLEVLPLS